MEEDCEKIVSNFLKKDFQFKNTNTNQKILINANIIEDLKDVPKMESKKVLELDLAEHSCKDKMCNVIKGKLLSLHNIKFLSNNLTRNEKRTKVNTRKYFIRRNIKTVSEECRYFLHTEYNKIILSKPFKHNTNIIDSELANNGNSIWEKEIVKTLSSSLSFNLLEKKEKLEKLKEEYESKREIKNQNPITDNVLKEKLKLKNLIESKEKEVNLAKKAKRFKRKNKTVGEINKILAQKLGEKIKNRLNKEGNEIKYSLFHQEAKKQEYQDICQCKKSYIFKMGRGRYKKNKNGKEKVEILEKHLNYHILRAFKTICDEETLYQLNFNDKFLQHDSSVSNIEAFIERNALVSHIEQGEVYVYQSYAAYKEEWEFLEFHLWE